MFENVFRVNFFNCLYKFQFGFRNKHSTNHALIQITESIRSAIDNDNYACGVFIDLQKAFDTVNHDILLGKLRHYGIRGSANNWFKSYLVNRTQYVSISGNHSKNSNMSHGVPQGSVLGPLLFLLYINDLNVAIQHSTTHHFADDTNLLLINKSLKQINKLVNHDLKLLCEWLRANKISLNVSKTEIILFRSSYKNITKKLNFRISGQKIKLSDYVKYLGIYLDKHLNWNKHLTILKPKLTRANGMLAKVRHYVPYETLKPIYCAIFNSHLTYGCQIWCQNKNDSTKKIGNLQQKAIRIINFKNNNNPSAPLFKETNILKLYDNITLLNCLFVYDHLDNNIPTALQGYFTSVKDTHQHNTRHAGINVEIPPVKTIRYGKNSITSQSVTDWNTINSQININPKECSRGQFYSSVNNYLLSKYTSNL